MIMDQNVIVAKMARKVFTDRCGSHHVMEDIEPLWNSNECVGEGLQILGWSW